MIQRQVSICILITITWSYPSGITSYYFCLFWGTVTRMDNFFSTNKNNIDDSLMQCLAINYSRVLCIFVLRDNAIQFSAFSSFWPTIIRHLSSYLVSVNVSVPRCTVKPLDLLTLPHVYLGCLVGQNWLHLMKILAKISMLRAVLLSITNAVGFQTT